MSWLSSPKVRLALIVNGLYFISLVTPTTPHTRPRLFARAAGRIDARFSTRTPPTHAPLAPPDSAPSKAAVNYVKDFDQLDVFLTNDLTLVRKPGHVLLLSPTFTTRMTAPEQPRSILLRFVSFSNEQVYMDTTPLRISADGVYRWDDSSYLLSGRGAQSGRHSVTTDAGGSVVETVGVELPYETFLEIINTRRVIVELGDDTAELNADQIEALRDMHRRLPQQQLEGPPPPADPPGKTYGVVTETKIIHDYFLSQPPDSRRRR